MSLASSIQALCTRSLLPLGLRTACSDLYKGPYKWRSASRIGVRSADSEAVGVGLLSPEISGWARRSIGPATMFESL